MPAIVTDIDGVLIRGGAQIPGSGDSIRTLRKPLSVLNPSKFSHLSSQKLPFICLTNGGGMMEETKADSVSKILDLKSSDSITKEDMVICSTPLKEIVPKYQDEYILIAGFGDSVNVAYNYGFTKAIHVHEYTSLFPFLAPLNTKYRSQADSQRYLDSLQKRLGPEFDLEKVRREGVSSLPFKACVAFYDVNEMEESLQVFSDLIISKDGIPGSKRSKDEPQFVEVYTTNPDLRILDI